MKKMLTIIIGLIFYNQSFSQCSVTSPDGWTIELNLSIAEVITNQAGSSCVANVVVDYNINLIGIGNLWTLQGTMSCVGANGSTFFNLPNNGGTGTVTSSNFSYSNTDCEDITFDCPMEITINGPGLNTTVTCLPALVLPVELNSFRYTINQSDLILDWETSEEINTEKFEILSSDDLRNWKTEGQVSANGTTNNISSYSYILDSPETEMYYKLRIKDFDGYEEFSKILHVDAYRGETRITIYPNPTHDQLKWQEDVEIDGIEIYSMVGNKVFSSNAAQENVIDLSELSPGTYVIVFTQGNNTQRQHFVKY